MDVDKRHLNSEPGCPETLDSPGAQRNSSYANFKPYENLIRDAPILPGCRTPSSFCPNVTSGHDAGRGPGQPFQLVAGTGAYSSVQRGAFLSLCFFCNFSCA